MSAYLYIWNPDPKKGWDWRDLQDAISSVKDRGQYDRRWSCGNRKRIALGDQAQQTTNAAVSAEGRGSTRLARVVARFPGPHGPTPAIRRFGPFFFVHRGICHWLLVP